MNQKNLVAATRFGGGIVEFLCYLGGVGFLDEGGEGIEAKGTTCKLLPPLDGGIWQLEDGACFYEGITFNSSKEE